MSDTSTNAVITQTKWNAKDRQIWQEKQVIQRSYQEEVVDKIYALEKHFDVRPYGALSSNAKRYPLFIVTSQNWCHVKPTVLITGGVHGYETSGVQGTLRFLQEDAPLYTEHFNFLALPCISPWSYETINRWNENALDPNRSFFPDSPCEECTAAMSALNTIDRRTESKYQLLAHFDLHETTDTDNTVFRPELSARDGIEQALWPIPDGFYLVADTEAPNTDFQNAIIESVKDVTHIAAADEKGNIIGETAMQEGLILYDTKKLNLCTGFTDSKYSTTTEVYPDSPRLTPEICIDAQRAAITGGLQYLMSNVNN